MSSVLAPARHNVGPISRTDIVRFAGAGGDFNPVHHDELFATNAGYPSVFAMGMLTAGLLGDYVASWLGIDKVRRFDVQFRNPVWPGDTLSLSATPITRNEGQTTAALSVASGDIARVIGEVEAGSDQATAKQILSDAPAEMRHLLATPPTDVTLPIERGKVMEFARAIKSTNPLHFNLDAARASGFIDLVAPLTFSAAWAQYNGGDAADVPKALGFDIARVLHGEERWTYTRPAVAGEVLTGVRTVEAVWQKTSKSGQTMTFVLLPTEYRDEDGKPVMRDEQVMIALDAAS